VSFHEDNTPNNVLVKKGLLKQEDVAGILTHATGGSYKLTFKCDGNLKDSFFSLSERFSGLMTLWEHNRKGQVSFMGWGYNISSTGKGYMRPLLANRAALASLAGCNKMLSSFGHIGSYAFARAGFTPGSNEGWKNEALKRTFNLQSQGLISEERSREMRDICGQDDPEAVWKIADLKDRVDTVIGYGSKKITRSDLGKYLLIDNVWSGSFYINNPKQLTRLADFVGHDTLAGAFANAIEVFEQAGVPYENPPPLPIPAHNEAPEMAA
jgi:hypothetical protein